MTKLKEVVVMKNLIKLLLELQLNGLLNNIKDKDNSFKINRFISSYYESLSENNSNNFSKTEIKEGLNKIVNMFEFKVIDKDYLLDLKK